MTDADLHSSTGVGARWGRLSLAAQFGMAGGVVLLIAMVIVGSWVSARIKEGVVRNTANATAQYMESFISPLSQDLVKSDTLSPGAKRALVEIFHDTPPGGTGRQLQDLEVRWTGGGGIGPVAGRSAVRRGGRSENRVVGPGQCQFRAAERP